MATYFGRGSFTTRGKDNKLRQYQYVPGLPLDGSTPSKGEDYYAVNLGVRAIQGALNKLPSTPGLLVKDGILGLKTSNAIKLHQKALGIKQDGIAGSVYCSLLWRPLIKQSSLENNVDPKYIFGQIGHECTFDPGAVGYFNPPDRGLVQVNTQAHPDISIEQAHNPDFAIPYSAKRFREAMDMFQGKGADLQIKAAIAQHNSPASAKTWFSTGVAPNVKIQEYVEKVLFYADQW